MTTNRIREHFLSRAPWVDPANTVDTVKAGDADRTVRRVEPGKSKQELLDRTGLVVLRCHDAWDAWPGIGIRDSWARGLGLTEMIAENGGAAAQRRWHAVYRIEPVTLRRFAEQVARRVSPLGQDGVEVLGDPERLVSHPAVGVGCGGPDRDMIEAGADVLVVCYDGARYWQDRERFVELGAAVLMVEHGTSEIWGMQSLARYLRETFPELEVLWYDRHPRPWHVAITS